MRRGLAPPNYRTTSLRGVEPYGDLRLKHSSVRRCEQTLGPDGAVDHEPRA